jgi:SAM-dependent methyltransferase
MGFHTEFGKAEAAYSAYRPRYPDTLFETILDALGGPRRRALDLGAGTGLSTEPLCRVFPEVVALEPDEKMAANLRQLDGNVTVVQLSGEELEAEPGSFDLVTCGNAFYWMDGPRMAAAVAAWLRPGGLFAVYRYSFPVAAGPVHALLEEELERHWDAFRHPRLLDEEYSRRVIREHPGFSPVEVRTVSNVAHLTPAEVVGFFSSTSYGSAYLRTLETPEAYLRDLEAAIREQAEGEKVAVDFGLELILATRPGG